MTQQVNSRRIPLHFEYIKLRFLSERINKCKIDFSINQIGHICCFIMAETFQAPKVYITDLLHIHKTIDFFPALFSQHKS